MTILCFYPKGSLNACAAEQEKLEGSDASDTESIVNSSEHKKEKTQWKKVNLVHNIRIS